MPPSQSCHYRPECYMCVHRFITRLIMKTFMICEKKEEKKQTLQRHVSVTETHHPPAYITDLMATCFFRAVYNLVRFFFFSFFFPLQASVSQSVDLPALVPSPQVTTEQLHTRCQDLFIAEVATVDKHVWEWSNIMSGYANTQAGELRRENDTKQERKLVRSSRTLEANFARWGGGILGEELLVHCNWTRSCRFTGGQSLTYVCVCELPVYIFVCAHVCTGTFAIAAMEGTDGRGKWTPVPEDYCGA